LSRFTTGILLGVGDQVEQVKGVGQLLDAPVPAATRLLKPPGHPQPNSVTFVLDKRASWK
jgi:hypothetical protein